MISKKLITTVIFMAAITLSCKDTEKEQQELKKQIEQIEATEATIDSTVEQANQKAEEAESLLKEIDSL